MHRQAKAYGQDPAWLLGIDARREPWLAWQLRRAVFAFGDWFERQCEATVEKPAPKRERAMTRVPKYSEERLRAMLGLDDLATVSARDDGSAPSEEEVDRLARAFLAGAFG